MDHCVRRGGAALVCIAATMLAAGAVAHAAEPEGWYVGAGFGMSEVDLSESLWSDASVTEASLDTGDFGYQVWAGYRLHPYFAIEGGAIDLGETIFRARSSGTGSIWNPGPITGRTRVRGMTIQAAAFWPAQGRLQGYAKGGMLFWSTAAHYDSTINDINRFNDNGGTPTGALGVQWRAWRGWWLRGEYQYMNITFAGRQTVNASLAMLGVMHYLP